MIFQLELDLRVQTEKLEEREVLELFGKVDLKTILQHQKLSKEIIRDEVIPLVKKIKRERDSISADEISYWQNIPKKYIQYLFID
jgi:hypothetical protein